MNLLRIILIVNSLSQSLNKRVNNQMCDLDCQICFALD